MSKQSVVFAVANHSTNNPLSPLRYATVTRNNKGSLTDSYVITNRSGDKLNLAADVIGPLIRALIDLHCDELMLSIYMKDLVNK